MSEVQTNFTGEQSGTFGMPQISVEGDLAQRNHHLHIPQYRQFAIQILRTVCQLVGERLVIRRSAADRSRDVAVVEFESVVTMIGVGLRSKSNLVQDGIHELARGISRKWPPRAVGTVSARRQSKNEDSRFGISKPGHRTR